MAIAPSLGPAARRFPLVPRVRPPCLPLDERIRRQLTEPAEAALRATNPATAVAFAASVQNQAALLASDCGLPDLAKDLCWRQFEAFRGSWPLDAPAARHALEPLVNLARLRTRSGDGNAAVHLLEAVYDAVTSRHDAMIDGRQIDFAGLVSDDGHRTVRRWLWSVLLAEGIRALAHEGRWEDAAAHAARHHGIGHRLLDGRQALILAHRAVGDRPSALAALIGAIPTTPWEHAVGACLTATCMDGDTIEAHEAVREATSSFFHLALRLGQRQFQVRLGLTVVDLCSALASRETDPVARRIVADVISSRDGLLARQVLGNPRLLARIAPDEERALSDAVRAAALDVPVLPLRSRRAIDHAVDASIGVICSPLVWSVGG